jgi:hypothetical protein
MPMLVGMIPIHKSLVFLYELSSLTDVVFIGADVHSKQRATGEIIPGQFEQARPFTPRERAFPVRYRRRGSMQSLACRQE